MKIIIVLEKYGGFCNRLFQSLHYHAFTIEKGLQFYNPTMLGLLKFDNNFYYFLDNFNNFLLKCISKLIKFLFGKDEFCFYFSKNNYIRFVSGWDYREYSLTIKHHEALKKIYSFEKKHLNEKFLSFIRFLNFQKKEDKFLVGLHVRRGDYKKWNQGRFFFNDDVYRDVIFKLKNKLVEDNKNPYFIVVSNENLKSEIGADFFYKGSWREDQIILQSCDLIIGPPSTFTMWASYISETPLIKLDPTKEINFNGNICLG